MKYIFFILSILVLAACCHQPTFSKVDLDNIRGDMAVLNYRLRGYLYNQAMNKDLSTLNEIKYLAFVNEQQQPSEKQYVEFLNAQKPEIVLKSSKTDFAICLKAKEVKIVLCDKASTGFTDFDSEDVSVDIAEKLKGIELK